MINVVSLRPSNEDSESFRRQFAINLNAALDHVDNMPRSHGRITTAAQLFGVSVNTMTGWLKGSSLPEMWRLPEIARRLDTSVDQLVTGDFAAPSVIDEQYAMLGVHGQHAPEDVQSIYALPETLRFLHISRDMRFMLIDTSDMEGFVSPGDFVIYNPGEKHVGMTNGIFVLSTNGNIIVRRACRTTRGQIVLSCDHPHMPDESLTDSDFTEDPAEIGKLYVLGRVIGKTTQRI